MAFRDNPFIIRNLPENKFIISPRREHYDLRLKYHQTEGRYTLAEAVEILSDEAKVDAVSMAIKLRQVVSDGSLKVYKPRL